MNVPELVIKTNIYNPIETINMQDLQQHSFEKTKEENLGEESKWLKTAIGVFKNNDSTNEQPLSCTSYHVSKARDKLC